MEWNANQYIKFEKERTQPSIDLIEKINFSPKSILDMGCGPGNSTSLLYGRFENSEITGIDISENMLKKARESYPYINFEKINIETELGKLRSYDLIFSNACLHWIPNHERLYESIFEKLNAGGMLAVQMPLVYNAEFYKLLKNFVKKEKWVKLSEIKNFHIPSPGRIYDILSLYSLEITMWETTYYHIVPSAEYVVEWYKGSGLKPYLDMLSKEESTEFLKELTSEIEKTYSTQPDNSVILKMPRLFFTATKY